jgi:hypothetical protein
MRQRLLRLGRWLTMGVAVSLGTIILLIVGLIAAVFGIALVFNTFWPDGF